MTKASTPANLGGQASFFLVGNIFTLLVGFPLQIYVARILGASNLGIFRLLGAGVNCSSCLSFLPERKAERFPQLTSNSDNCVALTS